MSQHLMQEPLRYSLGSWWRVFTFFMSVWFGLGVILTVVRLLSTSDDLPVRISLVAWIVIAVAAVSWYLLAVVYDLRLEGDRLLWIRVLAQKGFIRFARTLAERYPWVQVRIGWSARLLEWIPGSTSFRG